MTKPTSLIFAFLLSLSGSCHAQQTSNYDIAAEYVRDLAVINDIQSAAKKEAKQTKNPTQTFVNNIRTGTKIKLELQAAVGRLSAMTPATEAQASVDFLVGSYKLQIGYHDRLIDIGTEFLSGPKPEVNYGALTAEVPKISATLGEIDKSIFELANLIFAQLVDLRPDRDGHVSHLTITKAQRQRLIALIDSRFGASLQDQNSSWVVSGAWLMRSNLLKDFKSADEPW